MHKYITDLVAAFDKSIKRDPKDFPMISDIKDFDKFRWGIQATAKVQGVEQNGYGYKVLMDVVKDPSLKAELNKVPVGDGEQGWTAIKKKAEESTATKNASA